MAEQTNYLRSDQAAEFLNLAPSTLAKMRLTGRGPRYISVSGRMVLYDIEDLHAWINKRKRQSTSEADAAA